jgi:hypothetical protein
VNAYNLVTNWSSASFTPTSTTLTLNNGSAVNITHGQSVAVQISVSPTASRGDASLIAGLTAGSQGAGVFTLGSNGTVSSSTNLLPGGTYSVTAHYAGDGTHAASDSSPVPVNVAKEGSQTVVTLDTCDSSGSCTASATSVAYGSPYILRVDVKNSSGKMCSTNAVPCATGSVSLTDNGNPLNDFANGTNTATLNSQGYLEDQPVQLKVGSHSIVAAYAGDNSYTGSASSNTNQITITQASTTTAASSSATTIHSGDSVTLTALISTQSTGAEPGGTVQFYRGSTLLSGTVNYQGLPGSSSNGAYLQATLITTLSSSLLPVGDLRPPILRRPVLWLLPCIALFVLLLLWRIRPANRWAYASAVLFFFGLIAAAGFTGCNGSGNGSSGHTAKITAKYSGDTNYANSTSPAITITIQ